MTQTQTNAAPRVVLMLATHFTDERMYNVFNNQTNSSGPVYINIGDGGNREGPCPEYFQQPSWSAFREAKFGHGALDVVNATHMFWCVLVLACTQ